MAAAEELMEARLFGVFAPGKQRGELPPLPTELAHLAENDALDPEDAVDLLTRRSTEHDSRRLFGMYADCKVKIAAAAKTVATWCEGDELSEDAMASLRWAEVLSVVLLASFYWASRAEDPDLAKMHMATAIDGVDFKMRFLESEHGQRFSKVVNKKFGIVAF